MCLSRGLALVLRAWLLLWLCLACQPTAVPATPAATATVRTTPTRLVTAIPSASPTVSLLNGYWVGEGVTTLGKPIVLTLMIVEDGRLSSLGYAYQGANGKGCINLSYRPISNQSLPVIRKNRLDAALDQALSLSGVFNEGGTASGTLKITWKSNDASCGGTYEFQWTAAISSGVENVAVLFAAFSKEDQ